MQQEIKQKIERINLGEVPEGYKKTKIGVIPQDWSYDSFNHCVLESQYGLSEPSSDKGKPIIGMSDINNGKINLKINACVDIDEDVFQTYRVRKGDFLFNRTNSYDLVGKCAERT